ncbi:hypothetical protein [Rhizobium sp. BT04]|uniref:hypothetical protein n=1 Tax=Rhizobium sp. BT04 TaxID=3045157 RepID=UPI0024B3D513|nr:hypothetical protein [Rhizobium sp. BT04]
MISVSDQMHFDASLTRPLLRVRHYLTSIGKEAELDALLELWDASVAKSDFTEMAATFPSFLITLLDLTGEAPKAFQIEDDDEVRYALELLRRAIAGTDHQSLCATDSAFLEDTSMDLGGFLKNYYASMSLMPMLSNEIGPSGVVRPSTSTNSPETIRFCSLTSFPASMVSCPI